MKGATSPHAFCSHFHTMAYSLIDTTSALSTLLDVISGLETSPPPLFVDLEGNNLSRHGTISILQLYVHPLDHVYLIDVNKLGDKAFLVAGISGTTLASVIESATIPKVFFDVRNDSDALHSHFQIKLANVDDLQLMELAVRPFDKRCVNGLKRCIERDAMMTPSEKRQWSKVKDEGHHLFDPRVGGSYAVFDQRPLAEAVQSYCIQDVLHLPGLYKVYSRKLSKDAWASVRAASQARIEQSQGLHFNGKGRHMALSPWPGWPTTKNPHEQYSGISNTSDRKSDNRPKGLGQASPAKIQPGSHASSSQQGKSNADTREDSQLGSDIAALTLTAK